jgi:hypothetical protein
MGEKSAWSQETAWAKCHHWFDSLTKSFAAGIGRRGAIPGGTACSGSRRLPGIPADRIRIRR